MPWEERYDDDDYISRESGCILMSRVVRPLAQDLIHWMYASARYISASRARMKVVKNYTLSSLPFSAMDSAALAEWHAGGSMRVVRHDLQDALYDLVTRAPRFTAPLSLEREAAAAEAATQGSNPRPPKKPYVYIYRGLRSSHVSDSDYVSHDCSSWSLDPNVARGFAGTGIILRLPLTEDLAALNLSCMPFQGFGVDSPCEHLDGSEDAKENLRKRLYLDPVTGAAADRPRYARLPAALGHMSFFDPEHEVLLQPLRLEALRDAGTRIRGLRVFEGRAVHPLRRREGVLVAERLPVRSPSPSPARSMSPESRRLARMVDRSHHVPLRLSPPRKRPRT